MNVVVVVVVSAEVVVVCSADVVVAGEAGVVAAGAVGLQEIRIGRSSSTAKNRMKVLFFFMGEASCFIFFYYSTKEEVFSSVLFLFCQLFSKIKKTQGI